jgi:hypothetical protein
MKINLRFWRIYFKIFTDFLSIFTQINNPSTSQICGFPNSNRYCLQIWVKKLPWNLTLLNFKCFYAKSDPKICWKGKSNF